MNLEETTNEMWIKYTNIDDLQNKYGCFIIEVSQKDLPVCRYKENNKIKCDCKIYLVFYGITIILNTIVDLVLSPLRKWSWKFTFKDIWNMNLTKINLFHVEHLIYYSYIGSQSIHILSWSSYRSSKFVWLPLYISMSEILLSFTENGK